MKAKIIFVTAMAAALLATDGQAAGISSKILSKALKARIQQMQLQQRFECRDEPICGIIDLPKFYQRSGYRPVWVTGGRVQRRVNDLMAAVRSSRQEGLHPQDYHLDVIETTLAEAVAVQFKSRSAGRAAGDVDTMVDLELLCTDAYLMLGSQYLAGRINPETLYAKWQLSDAVVDLAAILQKAIDENRIQASLQELLPPHAGYAALKKKLAWYRFMQSTYPWKPIANGKTIGVGDRDPRLRAIAGRLDMLGDLTQAPAGRQNRFDQRLAQAVARFQRRHGLEPDGVVGGRTLAALNVPPARRIEQIEMNLERWRWIPHELGERYVVINIADYSLEVIEADRPVMQMRVVVGQNYRRTPVFSDTLEYIEVNPFWNVPTRLAVKDLLPKIQNDSDYLKRNDFSVLAGWQEGAAELDPADIDWSQVTADNFWYRLRQNPGPKNSLGRIKFMFPNRFAVYLHDTPSRQLFESSQRDFSSGCIRVERPFDLAAYLLDDPFTWGRQNLVETVDEGGNDIVRLKSGVAIHIMYWTAWVDRQGRLQLRDDVYERDRSLAAALQQRLPRQAAVRQAQY